MHHRADSRCQVETAMLESLLTHLAQLPECLLPEFLIEMTVSSVP